MKIIAVLIVVLGIFFVYRSHRSIPNIKQPLARLEHQLTAWKEK